ncbi:MAG TPA: glycoside hydrolase family 1 protein [bacterium]|nr:glycoside hydrolase family 1 protein [bacterium]
MGDLTFPPGFRWGTATSAHQVEGGNRHNDWWVWEQEGRVRGGQRSGEACRWWTDAEADFDRAAALHQNAHRLSIEWSRIEPVPDRWDEAALDRYRQLVAALRARGLEPMVTLHHFTNPRWLAERGGWERADTPARFVRFVERVIPALREHVALWCTLNEPVGWALSAYGAGRWPPGRRSLRAVRRVLDNLARAHAAAYRAIHRLQPEAQVGIAHYIRLFDPADPRSPLDRAVAAGYDRVVNRAFLDALTRGAARPLDFLGVNYYTRDRVAFDLRRPGRLFGRRFPTPGAPQSDGGYGEIYPEGMYRALHLAARYAAVLYVTENGLPDADDDQRGAFIVDHLRAVRRAIADGLSVRGYYHWSLVDNFEWTEGWSLRFGLIAVDPTTQERRLRPSARLYAEICRRNALP